MMAIHIKSHLPRRLAAASLLLMTWRAAPALASEAPRQAGYGYSYFYGVLHTQTGFSDGGWANNAVTTSPPTCSSHIDPAGGTRFTPARAFAYARDTAKLDFLGISDHNHYWSNSFSAATVINNYHTGLSAAAQVSSPNFVGIYGMEWGYNSNPNFPNEGHISLYETSKLFGWSSVNGASAYEVYTDPADYISATGLYAQALAPANAPANGLPPIGQFNHPADLDYSTATYLGDDFQQFGYTTSGDDLMHLLAVISGDYNRGDTNSSATGPRHAGPVADAPTGTYSPYTNKDMYNTALAAGFHVAPVADPDVHCSNYGNSMRDRTVVLLPTSSLPFATGAAFKAALVDAIHHRRVYATSNPNVQLVFTLTNNGATYQMGAGGIRAGTDSGRVQTTGAITLHVAALSANNSVPINSIMIKEVASSNQAAGTSTNAVTPATGVNTADFTLTPTVGDHLYYAYVKANGTAKDQLWSAPIWITQR